MPLVDRFTVSLDTELLAAFDRHIAARGYENRSEAVRDLIRDLLLRTDAVAGTEDVEAILTVACDHRIGGTSKRIRSALVEHGRLVHGSFHVPIDDHRDLMAIAVRGAGREVSELANHIQAMRGVSHGNLTRIPIRESDAR